MSTRSSGATKRGRNRGATAENEPNNDQGGRGRGKGRAVVTKPIAGSLQHSDAESTNSNSDSCVLNAKEKLTMTVTKKAYAKEGRESTQFVQEPHAFFLSLKTAQSGLPRRVILSI